MFFEKFEKIDLRSPTVFLPTLKMYLSDTGVILSTSSKFILLHPTYHPEFIQNHFTSSKFILLYSDFIYNIPSHRNLSKLIKIHLTPSYIILISFKTNLLHRNLSYFIQRHLT